MNLMCHVFIHNDGFLVRKLIDDVIEIGSVRTTSMENENTCVFGKDETLFETEKQGKYQTSCYYYIMK